MITKIQAAIDLAKANLKATDRQISHLNSVRDYQFDFIIDLEKIEQDKHLT